MRDGAPAWVTGAYDPDLNVLYWGTGNPGPDWNPDGRRGDNLYSCSLVALDANTGQLKWHFQFTPHDSHDYDSTNVPMLMDGVVRGQPRKLLALANRNAFYYLLDRTIGEFLSAKPYAKATWTQGIDDSGRPRVDASILTSPARDSRMVKILVAVWSKYSSQHVGRVPTPKRHQFNIVTWIIADSTFSKASSILTLRGLASARFLFGWAACIRQWMSIYSAIGRRVGETEERR